MAVLQTILLVIGIIFLAILLLILILLVIPFGARISYNSGFSEFLLKARIGFLEIPINLGSKKVKKKAAKVARETGKVAAEEVKEEIPKVTEDRKGNPKSPLEIYKTVSPYLEHVPEVLWRIVESIKFEDISIRWYVHTKDADKTAIKVGQLYAGFYSAVALLTPPFNFSFKQVEFLPNYTGSELLQSSLSVKITTSLLPFLILAIWLLTKLSRKKLRRRKVRKQNINMRKERKAV